MIVELIVIVVWVVPQALLSLAMVMVALIVVLDLLLSFSPHGTFSQRQDATCIFSESFLRRRRRRRHRRHHFMTVLKMVDSMAMTNSIGEDDYGTEVAKRRVVAYCDWSEDL